MKTPIALMSVGLLGSALAAAGVAGYLAWNSLTGEAELTPIVQSEPSTATPPLAQTVAAVSSVATAQPGQQNSVTWSKPENDYLFDLAQALQTDERERLSQAEQINIARKIQGWLESGADYWGVREQFDAVHRGSIAGDYAHNRDVYIKFATQHFAPSYVATLMQPTTNVMTSVRAPIEAPTEALHQAPFQAPEQAPYEGPYESPYEAPYEGPYQVPYEGPMAGPVPQPMPYPHPYADPHLYPLPYAQPYPHPQPMPYPDRNPYPYPNQNPGQNPNQNPYPPRNPNPEPSDSGIPNVTEVSAKPDSNQAFDPEYPEPESWQRQP